MKYDYLSVNSNCSELGFESITRCLQIPLSSCVRSLSISAAALRLGIQHNCDVDLLSILIRSVRVRSHLCSQAVRNLVCTGMSGRRRSIDMVSSEYAYFAPQSQHTRYVSPCSVKTRLR